MKYIFGDSQRQCYKTSILLTSCCQLLEKYNYSHKIFTFEDGLIILLMENPILQWIY